MKVLLLAIEHFKLACSTFKVIIRVAITMHLLGASVYLGMYLLVRKLNLVYWTTYKTLKHKQNESRLLIDNTECHRRKDVCNGNLRKA